MQYMLDVIDVFEGNLGSKNENGRDLREFLNGERWSRLMFNVERSIKGPFYFGDKPSCADFLLLAHLDWRINQIFDPLKKAFKVDHMARFPKAMKVRALL